MDFCEECEVYHSVSFARGCIPTTRCEVRIVENLSEQPSRHHPEKPIDHSHRLSRQSATSIAANYTYFQTAVVNSSICMPPAAFGRLNSSRCMIENRKLALSSSPKCENRQSIETGLGTAVDLQKGGSKTESLVRQADGGGNEFYRLGSTDGGTGEVEEEKVTRGCSPEGVVWAEERRELPGQFYGAVLRPPYVFKELKRAGYQIDARGSEDKEGVQTGCCCE